MKTIQGIQSGAKRRICGWHWPLLVVAALWPGLMAVGAEPAEKPAEVEPGEYANSVTFGVGHFFVDRDRAAFQRQWQRPGDETFGGIEELHFEQMIGERGLFTLDGRGLFNYRDYGLQVSLSDPEVGFVRGGYEQFRTFYDGSGGYSPRSNLWVTLYDEEFFVDRGRAWIEGGLTLPDLPVLTVRYTYDFREGRKDSTIWGDISLTGNNANLRAIVPTFWELDERRHTVDADLSHRLGNTDLTLGVRYSHDDQDNSRNIRRRPGDPARDRYLTHTESSTADLFNVRGSAESRLGTNTLLVVAYAYTRLDTDIGGSRIYGPAYGSGFNPISPNQQSFDEGFFDLGGGSQVNQYVGNVNLMFTPWKHLIIVPALRLEHQEQDGVTFFTETVVTNVAAPAALEDIENRRLRRFTDLTESLTVHYTGLTNWAFFARGEWLQGQGELNEREFDVADENSPRTLLDRDTDSERVVQKYVLGANWYPCRQANFGAQYFYRRRDNTYDHRLDSTVYNPPPPPVNTNNLYPAFIREQDFTTHDVGCRATLRPLANLTLVSRYDFAITTYDTRGDINSFGVPVQSVESARAVAHIFSQSVSWSPLPQLYLQGSLSYALQETETPASRLTGGAANLVQDANNDYWNATVLAGVVLNRVSDLQAQYFYYRADNYDPANATVSLPYDASAEQHGITLTLVNRLRRNVLWRIQYGYFTGNDSTSGRNNDYDAHLVYSSWQLLF
jgi:hypothetical protein